MLRTLSRALVLACLPSAFVACAATVAPSTPRSVYAPPAVASTLSAAPLAPVALLATTPDEPFRAKKPEALPDEPPFLAPVPVERVLQNGVRLLVVENHALPLVSVEVNLQRGTSDEPRGRAGLASFVATMMLEGTRGKTAVEVETASEHIGARLKTSAGVDVSTVHMDALRETFPEAMALLSDVLLHPAFGAADIERVRGAMQTAIAGKRGDAVALAADGIRRQLWGEGSPRGLPTGGTFESIKAITASDVRRFYGAVYLPNNAVVSVSGDITPEEVVRELDKGLGAWKRAPVLPRTVTTSPPAASRKILLSDIPGASQSQVWMAGRGPTANDPSLLPLIAANYILAGTMVTSRLNASLRTEKAITYWVSGAVDSYRDASAWVIHSGIISQHTAEGVAEFAKQLGRLTVDSITDEELSRAKGAIIRGMPSQLETNSRVATAVARLAERGLPLDYYATQEARARAITKADIAAAVARAHPESWPIVVVGAKAGSRDALKALGLGELREMAP